MAQTPKKRKKKRLLPKDILEQSAHEIMETLFGKRVMKEVDKLVAERSEGVVNKDPNNTI